MSEPGPNRPAARQLLRALFYLLFGVLPATGLTLLGSLLLLNGQASSIWLMMAGAWVGTLGLLCAAFFPPSAEHPGRSSLISLLLLIGELAMAPLSIGTVTAGVITLPGALLLIILGPTLLGLHYLTLNTRRLWRARSSWRHVQLTAILIAALALAAWLTHD